MPVRAPRAPAAPDRRDYSPMALLLPGACVAGDWPHVAGRARAFAWKCQAGAVSSGALAAQKKEPRKRGSKVLRGNGGVLFRDLWVSPNLTSNDTHGRHN